MVIPVRKPWPEAPQSVGFVHLMVRIANHRDDTRAEQLEMLADSGALYSVVPADVLQRIGVEASHTEEVELTDGRAIERRVGIAHVTVAGRQAAANVIFGEPVIGGQPAGDRHSTLEQRESSDRLDT